MGRSPVTHDEGRGLDDLAVEIGKSMGAQMQQAERFHFEPVPAQGGKTRQEHPGMLGDHGKITAGPGHGKAALHEHGKKIIPTVRILPSGKLLQVGAQIRQCLIRRIGDHHIVRAGEQAERFEAVPQLLPSPLRVLQILRRLPCCRFRDLIQGTTEGRGRKCIRKRCRDIFYFRQCVDMGPDAPCKEIRVEFPALHHKGKGSQPCRLRIQVHSVQVLQEDGLCRLRRTEAGFLIECRKGIEKLCQEMAAATAGIHTADTDQDSGISPARCRRIFLSGIGHIISKRAFRPGGTRVPAAGPEQGIFHKVASDPVGRKELSRHGQGLRGKLDMLFEITVDPVFLFGPIILEEPAHDLDMADPVLPGQELCKAAAEAIPAEKDRRDPEC